MYAGTKNKQVLKTKYLNYEEFKQLITNANLTGYNLADRDINKAFNLSIMT